MIQELFRIESREISLAVENNAITSVRKKNIVKSACRVYDNDCIGIAGTLGEAGEETWRQARENLALGIEYAAEPEKDKKRERDSRECKLSAEEFVSEMESFIDTISAAYPDFIFSNKLSFEERIQSLSNDAGLDYKDLDSYVAVLLLVKHKDSINIMDSSFIYYERDWDREKCLAQLEEFITAFNNKVELPKAEKLKVLCEYSFAMKIYEYTNGRMFGAGASPLAARVGERVFSEKFSFIVDRRAENRVPFFDDEGATLEGDMLPIIENGVMVRPYTCKCVAKQYGYEPTACADVSYDNVPDIGISMLNFLPGEKSAKELLDGETGVLLVMAEGGDFNDDGGFASPVQCAFLTDGEKLIGRLPEFSVTGELYTMFGDDFVGCTKDKPFFSSRYLAMEMKLG